MLLDVLLRIHVSSERKEVHDKLHTLLFLLYFICLLYFLSLSVWVFWQVWSLAAHTASLGLNPTQNIDFPWAHHPFGQKLINTMYVIIF